MYASEVFCISEGKSKLATFHTTYFPEGIETKLGFTEAMDRLMEGLIAERAFNELEFEIDVPDAVQTPSVKH